MRALFGAAGPGGGSRERRGRAPARAHDREGDRDRLGRRLRMGQIPGSPRAPPECLARAHGVRSRARRRPVFHRSRVRAACAGHASTLRRRRPFHRGDRARGGGRREPRRRARAVSRSSPALSAARRARERVRGDPRTRLRHALPRSRLRRRAPRHDGGNLAERKCKGAAPARLLRREGPGRQPCDERRGLPRAGGGLAGAHRPDALLGDERRRVPRHRGRRVGSPSCRACGHESRARVRPRARSRPRRVGGGGARRARTARAGAARRTGSMVDGEDDRASQAGRERGAHGEARSRRGGRHRSSARRRADAGDGGGGAPSSGPVRSAVAREHVRRVRAGRRDRTGAGRRERRGALPGPRSARRPSER